MTISENATSTADNLFIYYTTSSTSQCMKKEPISSIFIENGNENFIEVVSRQVQSQPNSFNASLVEIMVKELYGVVDGKLKLINTKTGVEKPGYYVPPTIEWNK